MNTIDVSIPTSLFDALGLDYLDGFSLIRLRYGGSNCVVRTTPHALFDIVYRVEELMESESLWKPGAKLLSQIKELEDAPTFGEGGGDTRDLKASTRTQSAAMALSVQARAWRLGRGTLRRRRSQQRRCG